MSYQVYKTTIKNILRSKLFIMLVLVSFVVIVYTKLSNSGTTIIFNSAGEMKTISKFDPRYRIGYSSYITYITNSVRALVSSYIGPIIAILSTALVLERDINDNFFEIEKSYGIISSKHVISKLLALVTVNFTFVTVASLFIFHLYTLMCGGVKMMGWEYYLIDSSIRLMRIIVLIAFPCSLIYMGLTYALGCIIKIPSISAIISIAYLLLNLSAPLKRIIPEIYYEYFTPLSLKVLNYLQWYDSYEFHGIISKFEVTVEQVYMCFIWTAFTIAATWLISCIVTKKRNI